MFAFADPEHVAEVITAAGWAPPRFEKLDMDLDIAAGRGLEEAVVQSIHIGAVNSWLRNQPAEVFSAVAEEVERLLDAQATAIGQLEPDGTMAIVASSGTARDELPVGSRLKLESELALTTVVRTGRSARIDGYGRASESVHRRAERLGIRGTVAVPIMVEGSLWGSTCESSCPGSRPG